MRHDAGDIAWHTRSLWRHVDTPEPIVRARPSPVGEGLQVLVYAPDRPDLFARICGYFDSAGFSILDAKIHTTTTGYALDTFQVVSPHLEPALPRPDQLRRDPAHARARGRPGRCPRRAAAASRAA